MLNETTVKLLLTGPMIIGNEYAIFTLCEVGGYKYMKVIEITNKSLERIKSVRAGDKFLT